MSTNLVVEVLREAVRQIRMHARTDAAGDARLEQTLLAVADLCEAEAIVMMSDEFDGQEDPQVLAIARAYLARTDR